MKQKFKLWWFQKISLYFYTKLAYKYGDMLSYAYMGKAVGFDAVEQRILKYMKTAMELGIKPWSLNQMSATGWGHKLPPLVNFTSKQEMEAFIQELTEDFEEVESMLKIDLANQLF